MTNRSVQLVLASAFASALALASAPAQAADEPGKEKCYGISLAGKNDCASSGGNGCAAVVYNTCAGASKADFETTAWKYVPSGTCVSTEVTLKDGSKRKGSLEPSEG